MHTRTTLTQRGVTLALLTVICALGATALPDPALRWPLALCACASQLISMAALYAAQRRE